MSGIEPLSWRLAVYLAVGYSVGYTPLNDAIETCSSCHAVHMKSAILGHDVLHP